MEFADNIMALRRSRGWSQEELGDRLGVSRQTVSKWETGQTTPELEKLIALADVYDLSLDELVGRTRAGESGGERVPDLRGVRYEYVSPRRLWGLPLVHVRLGGGARPVRGIVAVGNTAVGVVAVGGLGVGLFTLSGFGVGLIALGGLAVGLAAAGGVAVGAFALGGVAVGWQIAMGGTAVSRCLAVGGVSLSNQLAVGYTAQGVIAVGQHAEGLLTFGPRSNPQTVWEAVKEMFPRMWEAAKYALGAQ